MTGSLQSTPKGAGRLPKKFSSLQNHKLIITIGVITLILLITLPIGIVLGLRHNGGADSQASTQENDNATNASPRPSLWRPLLNSTWQIILISPLALTDSTILTRGVSVYELDLFDNRVETFRSLQQRGIKVTCYFSGGSFEKNRPDSTQFQSKDLGKQLDGWPDEKWLNVSSPNVRSIMKTRIQLAASKGCDAIDADNVDGYSNNNGLGLKESDSVDFVRFLNREARLYNMAVGLKNALSIIPAVLEHIDFAVNEQCVQYNECDKYSPLVRKGKPVFHIEYPSGNGFTALDASRLSKYCSDATLGPWSTVLKKLNLDGVTQYCNGTVITTSTGI